MLLQVKNKAACLPETYQQKEELLQNVGLHVRLSAGVPLFCGQRFGQTYRFITADGKDFVDNG